MDCPVLETGIDEHSQNIQAGRRMNEGEAQQENYSTEVHVEGGSQNEGKEI